jgi:glutathione S-transferase
MIVLHQYETSPFCNKVRRILNHKQVPYEIAEVPPSRTPLRVPRLNPIGKLPCLEHDGVRISDSTNIAHYLENKFPDPPLMPGDLRGRALCHMLEDWADESLYFYEMTLRFLLPHNARRMLPALVKHDPAWLRFATRPIASLVTQRTARAQGTARKPLPMILEDVGRHVAAVSDLLESAPFLLGERLTLADIAVFVQLVCFADADEGRAAIDAQPAVVRWMERVDSATRAAASCDVLPCDARTQARS